MRYKNAFNCKKCPQRGDEEGCPCWVEMVETNVKTGEERVVKDCLFKLLPSLMIEVIKASNRPAAAIESTRNALVESLARGFSAMSKGRLIRSKKDVSAISDL